MRAMAMILESGLSIQRRMNDVWVATFPVVKKQRKIKKYVLCSSNDNVLPITAMINSNKRKKKKIAIFARRLLKTVRTESNMLLKDRLQTLGRVTQSQISVLLLCTLFFIQF